MDLKEEVYDVIKKEGEIASSKIAGLLNRDYYSILRVLTELESEKKIIKREEGKFTYWKVNIYVE